MQRIVHATELAAPPAQCSTALGASVLTYRLQPTASGGTRFERICDFRSEGAWKLLDGNITKWMLAAQAKNALANLRAIRATEVLRLEFDCTQLNCVS